ncbi:hypothetical protein D0Z67_29290 (plasmid) [Streptomyces seoulensis]|uniref:Uncharacterized protein n=1 Tax=Streptomyces seoulensis TaxID=73044 RepID=A0A4V1A0G1_STRSO|nr:hypothetical protein [Streptomyces seoulensis]QBJ94466.1 hypothetical protein D0Z67_29290 [Streptomyces seoulensis]
MSKDMTIAEIVAMAKAEAAKHPNRDTDSPRNINIGVLHGGQHVSNVTITGDYIPNNKTGKSSKKGKKA